ncbi:MAG: hypothetical protein ACKVW3_15410 [Phycisphaerales bacterium]
MERPDLIEQAAAVAHEAWRSHMEHEGWRSGPYDAAARTHDALVPFERLDPRDHRRACVAIEAEGAVEWLAGLVRYTRGPGREFAAHELKPGLPVVLGAPGGEGSAGNEVGRVESWDLDHSGALRVIRVRWPNGAQSEHFPAEQDLRRA